MEGAPSLFLKFCSHSFIISGSKNLHKLRVPCQACPLRWGHFFWHLANHLPVSSKSSSDSSSELVEELGLAQPPGSLSALLPVVIVFVTKDRHIFKPYLQLILPLHTAWTAIKQGSRVAWLACPQKNSFDSMYHMPLARDVPQPLKRWAETNKHQYGFCFNRPRPPFHYVTLCIASIHSLLCWPDTTPSCEVDPLKLKQILERSMK